MVFERYGKGIVAIAAVAAIGVGLTANRLFVKNFHGLARKDFSGYIIPDSVDGSKGKYKYDLGDPEQTVLAYVEALDNSDGDLWFSILCETNREKMVEFRSLHASRDPRTWKIGPGRQLVGEGASEEEIKTALKMEWLREHEDEKIGRYKITNDITMPVFGHPLKKVNMDTETSREKGKQGITLIFEHGEWRIGYLE